MQEIQQMDKFGLGKLVKKDYKILKSLKTRWVDTPRSDGTWKSRFVAREFRGLEPNMDGLYIPAATNDLQRLNNVVGMAKNFVYVIDDASNAHFHCDEDEKVACIPPQEMLDAMKENGEDVEDTLFALRKKLYGRPSASAAYGDVVAKKLRDLGLSMSARTVPTETRDWD